MSDAVLQVVVFSARYYVKGRGLPFPRPWDGQSDMMDFSVYLPIFVALAAVPVLVASMRGRSHGGDAAARGDVLPWTLSLLSVATLLFFNKGIIRVDKMGMAAALVTTAALSCLLLAGKNLAGRAGRGLVLLSGLATLGFTLRLLPVELARAHVNVGWARDPDTWRAATLDTIPKLGTCRMPPGLERMDCFRLPAGTVAAI